MTDPVIARVAKRLVGIERRVDGLSRTRQLPLSSVEMPDGTDQDIASAVIDAVDTTEALEQVADQVGDVDDLGDSTAIHETQVTEWVEASAAGGDLGFALAKYAADLGQRLETELGEANSTIDSAKAELDEKLALLTSEVEQVDLSRLVASEALLDEAVIAKLWADVVKTNFLTVTEQIVAGSAIIKGSLTAEHMAAKFFESLHLKSVLIEGGQFVGATYELQATDTWSTVYNPGAVTSGTVGDFFGGSPTAPASATLISGAARVTAAAGKIVGLWQNPGVVDPVGEASRRVSIRVRPSVAMSGVHIMVGDKLVTGPNIPANTWTTLTIELSAGDSLDWIHVAGVTSSAVNLDMDTVKVESAALAGAKLTVSHRNGVPGLRVMTAAGATILDLSPNGLVSTNVAGNESATLQYGQLSFTGGGETVTYDRNGINNPAGVHALTSPGGIALDGPLGSNRALKVLATSSGSLMAAAQTISLSEPISAQLNGIIVSWSRYDGTNPVDTNWSHHFIPKSHLLLPGSGSVVHTMAISATSPALSTKLLFVTDSSLTGHDNNNATGNNRNFVLRQIVGV